jgi:hypothetical protein
MLLPTQVKLANHDQRFVGEPLRLLDQEPRPTALQEVHAVTPST